METIRNEILEKINAYKNQEKERRKHENIHLIISEKDFFKDEAVRLNFVCRSLNNKNKELTKENKILTTELDNLSKKWKDSENINKQLLIELERNIDKSMNNEKKIEQLFTENERLKNDLNILNEEKDFYYNKEENPKSNNDNNSVNLFDKNSEYNKFKEKIIKSYESLKAKHKKEKNKLTNIIKDLNKQIQDKTIPQTNLMQRTGVTFPSVENKTMQSFGFLKSGQSTGLSFMNNNWVKTKQSFFNKFK